MSNSGSSILIFSRLESYSWKDQVTRINESVPQFRAGIRAPNLDSTTRIHFIHARSIQVNAVPLLLIPPFPFTNLSVSHLIESLVDPADEQNEQAFHLIIPSLPGLGFSDALPNNVDMVAITAQLLDSLMQRLDYTHYIVSTAGPAAETPCELDGRIADYLATFYSDSCCGANLISPPLEAPKLRDSLISWVKWKLASTSRSSILGYHQQDFIALERTKRRDNTNAKLHGAQNSPKRQNHWKCWDPTTLSYALCDSPAGLALFIVSLLQAWAPHKDPTPQEIVTMTILSWLPGPEAALRFWSHSTSYVEHPKQQKQRRDKKHKPKVALTVFMGNEYAHEGSHSMNVAGPVLIETPYSCPAWASTRYDTTDTLRIEGKPGLLAWERPDVIAKGVRALSKSILTKDPRLRANLQLQEIAALERVAVGQD